uniref:Uncharacterized protein n=1 Tax=Daphnia galeata TaxID=27404 RepID=A0A8J2RXC3_9CRUS|nr:unnamed protein product [Daphnia galeata]
MRLCQVSVKRRGLTGIFNADPLLDLKQKVSERFLFFGSFELLQLRFDEFPVVTEDDFLSLCSIGGTVKLSVVIPDDDDTSSDNPNNKQNDEAIIDNVTGDLDPDADNTAFQENVRDAEKSLKEYYPIRDIIRENGWDKTRVDSLFARLDDENAELSKKDRSSINIAVGKWLYKNKGINAMPKPAEFDMAARSIVAHFPIAKDPSSTIEQVIYSSWYDVNSNVGRLLNYVRDRRSDNKNKGAVVRSYTKRNRIEESDEEIDISLTEKERFMRENQVTADNKERMVQFHRDTMETRRKWIADKKPTIDCDVKSADGWETALFTERWKKIEKSLAIEILKKHGVFLEPNAANERTLLIFQSLPVLFPPRPSRGFKGNTVPNVTMLSKKLVRRFPNGTNLAEALQQAESDGMIQPGLIVIGDRRYIKADLIPIKISTSSAAESISILFAVYHIFNLNFPEHLNLVYNFLQNMVNFVEKETSQPPNKKKKSSSKSLFQYLPLGSRSTIQTSSAATGPPLSKISGVNNSTQEHRVVILLHDVRDKEVSRFIPHQLGIELMSKLP